ncbi:hypothetical protein ABPG72_018051 [Tetrahymena utriculariae]
MNIFAKFRVSSSVQKAQKLWADFKKVSHLQDDPETLNRLKKFLDHVKESLKTISEKNDSKKQIDGILGEASDILKSLLKFLEEYDKKADSNSPNNEVANEIVNQVLEIVEFILRDDKYRKQIENSQTILNNFLSVAEKLDKSESKVTVVELIIMIAENVDSKVSFVQKEGFSKLMKMLMDKDERVSRVISRALLHFLQIDNSEESRLLNEMQGHIEEKEEFNSIKKKIKKIALDFRKFTFNEIQRIFLQNDNQNTTNQVQEDGNTNIRERQQSVAKKTSLYNQNNRKDSNGNILSNGKVQEFVDPPTYEDIFEMDLKLLIALKINQQNNISEQANILSSDHLEISVNSNERVIQQNNNNNNNMIINSQQNIKPQSNQGSIIEEELEEQKNNQASINYQGGQGSQVKSIDQQSDQSDEIFTILQGGFKAILKTLHNGNNNEEAQLNLMQTIYKLLSSEDQKYKAEFRKVRGYEVLAGVINRVRNYVEEKNQKFLESMMKLYVDIIINDKEIMQIMNFDAFETFIKLISASQQYEVISLSLDNLKKLFLSNWKNLIIARRLKSTYHLLALIMRLFESEYENSSSSIFQSLNGVEANGITNQINKNTENHHEISILGGLKYVYQLNNQIFYSSEITQSNMPIGKQQREQLLQKVNEILKIYSYVEGSFSTEYEYAFTEIILKSIQRDDNKNSTIYFLDTLFDFMERKQQRKCCQISTFDNTFHGLIECLKEIATILLQKVTTPDQIKICLDDDETVHYLGKFLFFSDQYLSCDHSSQQQKDERMKKLERENTLIKSIICRNQCEETKKIISEKYVNKLQEKEEVKMLMKVIKFNKLKNDNNYTEYAYRVVVVLKDILVNNPQRAQQFIEMDGIFILSYLVSKIIQDFNYVERACMLFIDICLNVNNSNTILSNPLLKQDDEKIPSLEPKRSICLNALICSLFDANLKDSHHVFFEYLGKVILKSNNLKVIKSESYMLIFLLELLNTGRVLSKDNNLYTQILSILERIIQKPNSDEIKLVLDSLLNYNNLMQLSHNKQSTSFFTDALSIMAIHILLNTTPQLHTRPAILEKVSPLLEKIISQNYMYNLFGCLYCHNLEVTEMVLKFILSCMSIYSKTKKTEGYGKKEYFYHLIGEKLQKGKINQNICKILYDFTFWEYNPNILYPSNSSVVSTLLNRSGQANSIMNLSKSQMEQQKGGKTITNIHLLEIFFKVLKEYEPENQNDENSISFRNEMLNIFEAVLDEPNNVNLILDQTNFLNWFYLLLPNKWQDLSDPHDNFNKQQQHFNAQQQQSSNISQSKISNNQINNSINLKNSAHENLQNNQSHLSNHLFNSAEKKQTDNSVLAHDQTNQHIKSELNNNNNSKNQLANQNPQMKMSMDSNSNNSSQSLGKSQKFKQISNSQYMAFKLEKEKIFTIIQKIMAHFFHRKPVDFDFIEYFKRFSHTDDDFVNIIIKNFFNELLSGNNCIFKDDSAQYFLKNFKVFIDSIDSYIGFEAEIHRLILQCIMKMFAKGDQKIRAQMKNLGLFEKRDNLVIKIITYEQDGNKFVKVFECISFEALVNHPQFEKNHSLSSLMKIFIQNQNNFPLQILIMTILKNPSLSESNQKYVANLLENPKLIQFLFPTLLRRKQSSIAKCLQSNLNNSNNKNNNSNNNNNNDDNDQDSDSQDEGEGEDAQKRKQSASKSVHRGASFEDDFLNDFYSQENENLRREIINRIELNLRPILKEKEKEEKSIKDKKKQDKQKQNEALKKEAEKAKEKISKIEQEIQIKLQQSFNDYKIKQDEFNSFREDKMKDGERKFLEYSKIV